MSAKVRLLRIKRDVEQHERTNEIEDFLNWCSVPELWEIAPLLSQMVPESVKPDYPSISSTEMLMVFYDGIPHEIRPMLANLFADWKAVDPLQVNEIIAGLTEYIYDLRSSP